MHDRGERPGPQSSVRYLGASSLAFFMDAAWSALPCLGGAVVRVATGTPTCAKNSSCPAGTLRHNSPPPAPRLLNPTLILHRHDA
jgi:hypothetical protein